MFTYSQVMGFDFPAAAAEATDAVGKVAGGITSAMTAASTSVTAMNTSWTGAGYDGASGLMSTLSAAHEATASDLRSVSDAITSSFNTGGFNGSLQQVFREYFVGGCEV